MRIRERFRGTGIPFSIEKDWQDALKKHNISENDNEVVLHTYVLNALEEIVARLVEAEHKLAEKEQKNGK